MTARKGFGLPSGHGEALDDAHKLYGTFVADGTVKPYDAVQLSSDEKTLNVATASSILTGVAPYFDETEVEWGSTVCTADTAYPTTVTLPYIYDHGTVVGRASVNMAANTQLGCPLATDAGGTFQSAGISLTRAYCADLLAPTGGSAKMLVRLS